MLTMHPGQVGPARWFAWWLRSYLDGSMATRAEPITDLVCAGGRRGGKTDYAMAIALAFAVAVPDSIVWIVCRSDQYFKEPTTWLNRNLPREWYRSLGAPHYSWTLANGSQIRLLSGFSSGKMKQGKAHFVVINEAQRIPTASYATMSASIVDEGGLIVSAANPPDSGDPGEWVATVAAGAMRETNPNARFFFFDPEVNPHINIGYLHALRRKMDKRTYDVQVRGLFLLPPDSVLHQWSQVDNELLVPQLGRDITREFTRHFEGREYDDIVGVDVQKYPWIAGVRMRAFENPTKPGDISEALLWGVGEVFLEQGDEINFAEGLKRIGCKGSRTLIVCDATARWQQQEREHTKQREKFRGAGSWDLFTAAGFPHIVGPDPEIKGNPDVIERCRGANARICNADGDRYVYVDPEKCPKTVASIRGWRVVHGKPDRRALSAHGGDALTYLVWRFFPRRDLTEHDVGQIDLPKRLEGAARTKGFT